VAVRLADRVPSRRGAAELRLFDSNYHDGFAAVGGLIIGLVVAVAVFKAILKKLTTWAYTSPDRSHKSRAYQSMEPTFPESRVFDKFILNDRPRKNPHRFITKNS
jgi:hypothetical protein